MYRRRMIKWVRTLAMLIVCFTASNSVVSAFALDDACLAQLKTTALLVEQDLTANMDSIRIMINNCINGLAEDDPIRGTLQSILILLDSGNANAESIALLLRTAIDSQGSMSGSETREDKAPTSESSASNHPAEEPGNTNPSMGAEESAQGVQALDSDAGASDIDNIVYDTSPLEPSALGLPVFEVSAYIKTVFQNAMLVDIPLDWGNNASGKALTSYSPVNDSGAISPAAGTLTISYFSAEGQDDTTAFDTYTKNIESMSVTTSLSYEDITAASLPARKICFTMNVGANQFSCETVCFSHQDTIYTIELMQGQQTKYDYFPVYHRVVSSAEVGDEATISEILAHEEKPAGSNVPTTQPPEVPPVPTPKAPAKREQEPTPTPSNQNEFSGDIGSFQYAADGHVYQFPTSIRDLAEGVLPLQLDITIPYDYSSDADMLEGSWTEIVNTQYFYFESAQHKEIAGITNLKGYPVGMLDCMLTALIDTDGTYVDIVLPGDVRVGGQERDILRGFPEFAGMALDGVARFRGNELLYACNVRDDGCNGYVLIRNDAPYYSAVSIICENGLIREISFECLGSIRAQGVFL